MTDDKMLELRRRVQADPASMAFAPLAEELRRAGANDEAVAVCRAGLVHHPDNLTARVTLGRALVELGQLDDAFTELTFVLDAAPGNLPAIRALAEVYQRRGMVSEALVHYRRALQLSQHDADPGHTVGAIQPRVAPQGTPPTPRVEELFDFDALLAQLDHGRAVEPAFVPLRKPPDSALDAVVLLPDDQDAFAVMERQLREREEQRLAEERGARQADAAGKRLLVLRELETWLAAITADRQQAAENPRR